MNINELNKEELQKVTELYIKERDTMAWLCSLEEFCESFIRKCESCGELILVDDYYCELPIAKNYRGNEYHCCETCYDEMR